MNNDIINHIVNLKVAIKELEKRVSVLEDKCTHVELSKEIDELRQEIGQIWIDLKQKKR